MNKRNSKEEDGEANRPVRKAWAYPAGLGETGIGLLETLAGLVIFMILAVLGTKALKGAVASHKEADQVKGMTDAVATTAEKLSAFSLAALAGAGSTYLQWSDPVMVGRGPNHYRYRTVPRPSVGGASDTSLVGLEVESGTLQGGAFLATRTFATLIPPSGAKNALGQVTTQAERDAEAAFFYNNTLRISQLTHDVVSENQVRLNSFSCYDKTECCGFMREYFANPTLKPSDGLKEKCLYRCALGGDVPMADWRRACGMDFCTIAPWRDKLACCKAIDAGECKPGTVCARVCLECVGENGDGCYEPRCEDRRFNDFFDCANNTFCDGSALPVGEVAGWGNIREMCKVPNCAEIQADCGQTAETCCRDYWDVLARGRTPDPKMEVCASISTKAQCCSQPNRRGYWDVSCTNEGRSNGVNYNGTWYCADSPFLTDIHQYCSMYAGCGGVYIYSGVEGSSCGTWPKPRLQDPWVNPDPPPPPPPKPYVPPTSEPTSEPIRAPAPKPSLLEQILDQLRKTSKRDGGGWNNGGGRE